MANAQEKELLCDLLESFPEPTVLLNVHGEEAYLNERALECAIADCGLQDLEAVKRCLSEGRLYEHRRESLTRRNEGPALNGYLTLFPVRALSGAIIGALLRFEPDDDADAEVYSAKIPYVSEDMELVSSRMNKAARVGASVMFTGPDGVGRESFARAVHAMSVRASRPFVRVDCARPGEVMSGDPGRICGAGTVYFDGVQKLGTDWQEKLCHMLQNKELDGYLFEARVMSCTTSVLNDMLKVGSFSDELYMRLSLMTINIPPLASRPEDIEPAAMYYLRKYSALQQKKLTGFSQTARRLLSSHLWEGNLAELHRAVKEAAERAPDEGFIEPEHLPLGDYHPKNLHKLRDSFTKERIVALLNVYGHSLEGKKRAAAELGIGLSTLYRILAR